MSPSGPVNVVQSNDIDQLLYDNVPYKKVMRYLMNDIQIYGVPERIILYLEVLKTDIFILS